MITINVTEEDIANGECGSPWKCAVALAVKRATKAEFVSVGCGIRYTTTDREMSFLLPDDVIPFIELFDGGYRGMCKPFSFELDENSAL